METRFTVLLIELGVAIAVQIALLLAILSVVKRSGKRMELLADEVQRRAVPALDAAKTMLENARPQVEEILANAAASTSMLRQQMERLEVTLNDLLDRTRLQVIRADELVTRTMDRVEETTDIVSHTVVSPVRQLAGIVQGITAGFAAFFGRQRSRERTDLHQDEMFI